MVTFKKLNTCTLEQVAHAWNSGFEGYAVNISLTVDGLLNRMAREGLSADLSIVAFVEEEPVGIVLNGIRTFSGKKVVYNGGTGVATRYRGKGVSQAMMEEALKIYREADVDVATLEAISENERAIRLYRKFGYEVQGRLVFLVHNGPLAADAFGGEEEASTSLYRAQGDLPIAVSHLPFYNESAPWQCQWVGLQATGGQALLVQDVTGETVGYALYKQVLGEEGAQIGRVLYQCEVAPARADREAIARFLLRHVFAVSEQNLRRQTFNFSESNQLVVQLLRAAGFAETASQVAMVRPMEKAESYFK